MLTPYPPSAEVVADTGWIVGKEEVIHLGVYRVAEGIRP
jgi:hypothetical protein